MGLCVRRPGDHGWSGLAANIGVEVLDVAHLELVRSASSLGRACHLSVIVQALDSGVIDPATPTVDGAGNRGAAAALLRDPRDDAALTGGRAAWIGAAVVTGALLARWAYRELTMTTEQRSIRASARRHERLGRVVFADHLRGYRRPPIMGGRRPDVVATDGRTTFVEEHETFESVRRTHSAEQDRDLRRHVSPRPRTQYRLVVA
jgi:hypothetical protein